MDHIDVYISSHYSSSRQLVDLVARELEDRGISCWYAPRNVSANYADSIVSAIKRCRVFLVMLNREASESSHVLTELSLATDRQQNREDITVIPFRIDSEDISASARYYLGPMHWVDGVSPPLRDRINELVDKVAAALGTQNVQTNAVPMKSSVQVKPYDGDESFLFVSYSHKNTSDVIEVIRALQERGYRVWYDEGIDPGTEWDDFIAEQIEKCGYMIAFISKEYLDSDNCKDELNFARDLNKKRLLVYIEDVTLPRGMAMRLNRLQAIHKYKYASLDAFVEKLQSADGLEMFRS